MQSNLQYPVNEIFATIQGEATFAGTPSIFIRLQGCDVGCSWCDTKHSWNTHQINKIEWDNIPGKTSDKNSWAYATIGQIKKYMQTNYTQIKHVVITGGEPAIYDLSLLCLMLEEMGKNVQIETSGTSILKITPDTWVTLSPKIDMPGGKLVLSECVIRANEIKMPIGKIADIEKLKLFLANDPIPENVTVWLQPLSQNPGATKICIEQALLNNWRLSLQTHKFINIR
jgi:7-carboxy-7-deazaguanine synthase